MVLPLLLAGAGLAAAGTVGNRFFQDYADERQQRRQGDILGGILDNSQGPNGLNYDQFGQNLLRGGFQDLGGQTVGQQQQHGNRLAQMKTQHGYSMSQIGARSASAENLVRLKAQLAADAAAAAQNPGQFGLTPSQLPEYLAQTKAQSARLDASAQIDHLVDMANSSEGIDITGDRAGTMEHLRTTFIPILQEKFNTGTLNEGEQELFDAMTGDASGWIEAMKSPQYRGRTLATWKAIGADNAAAIDRWNQSWGLHLVNAVGPGGTPLGLPQQTWFAPASQVDQADDGTPLTATPPSGGNFSGGG